MQLALLLVQASAWPPSPGHTQMPIWPGLSPHAWRAPGPEIASTTGNDHLVVGRPWTDVSNVSQPTLTVYSPPPQGKNTGVAVVVFPGGGYQILAIDLEGTEVCDWLLSKGITCVLLKYRVPNTGPTWDQRCGCDRKTRSSMALEDAQRTVGLVRLRAARWHIDPHKIGVLGFSAGGHLVALLSTHFDARAYAPLDSADQQNCRPDFAVAVYPGHLFEISDYGVASVGRNVAQHHRDHFRLEHRVHHLYGSNPCVVISKRSPISRRPPRTKRSAPRHSSSCAS